MKKLFLLILAGCALGGCASGKHPTFTWETDADWWANDRKIAEESVGCTRCGILQHRRQIEELNEKNSTLEAPTEVSPQK